MVLPGSKEPVPGLLLDLSRSGMFIRGKGDLELGTRVVVRFQLRTTGWCEADGTVVRRTQVVRLHGFGVHFDKMNSQFTRFMDDLASLSVEARKGFLAEVLTPVIEVADLAPTG